MAAVWNRLSAAEELCLQTQAEQGFEYLCFLCGKDRTRQEKEGLWALANNAAVICLAMKEGNRQVFYSAREVLESLSLQKIAALAREYHQEMEGEEETVCASRN